MTPKNYVGNHSRAKLTTQPKLLFIYGQPLCFIIQKSEKKMTKKLNIILYPILLIAINYSYSQNQIITTPSIESPEQEFISVFQKDKLSNPIFLNGAVKEVKKKVREHVTLNRKIGNQKNYDYSLNSLKQISKYSSDEEFDDMTPELLNIEKEVVIKGDTIINHDNIWYTFKKGKLKTKTEKTAELSSNQAFMDSLSFNYKKNKLIEIHHYKRDIVTEVNESSTSNLIEYNLLYTDYEIKNYTAAKYGKNGLLNSKLDISTIEDLIFVYKTSYQYNDSNKITSFKRVFEEHDINVFNFSEYIKNTEKYNVKAKPIENEEHEGVYYYDEKNRIIKIEIEKFNEGKHTYNIRYYKNTTTVAYLNKGKFEMEFQFTYDNNNNPIKELKYINIDGRKHLDTSIVLDITYY